MKNFSELIPSNVSVSHMRCEWYQVKYLYQACESVFQIPDWELFGWPEYNDPDGDFTRNIEALVGYATPPEKVEWYNQVCIVKQHLGRRAFEVETITSCRVIAIDYDRKYVDIDFKGSLRAASAVLSALARITEEKKGLKETKVEVRLTDNSRFDIGTPEEFDELATFLADRGYKRDYEEWD
ncbi:hypothetical protein P4H94_04495 [Paenibacillus macerans]|uniref:hypothetical protein n=1 Tax=Paenibacillus macerans TaxID=44252 RepID=UPI002DBF7B8A|nr:hypothetical protein [Paenibacillus macerans]MEC0136147.1 hypothetical protein [Paenibacillus macerans]